MHRGARPLDKPASRGRSALKVAAELTTSARARRSWLLRVRKPENLFQPSTDTWEDRYPEIFSFLGQALGGREDVNILSFGCSSGEEVFTLRRYLPSARLKGIDISRGNIAACQRRQRQVGDHLMEFVRGNSASGEPPEGYDAVLCMAVFRHGDLARRPPTAEGKITFRSFEIALEEVARGVKAGGYVAIEHANFLFADTWYASRFECVLQRVRNEADRRTPIYGRDNRLVVHEPETVGVLFQKLPT